MRRITPPIFWTAWFAAVGLVYGAYCLLAHALFAEPVRSEAPRMLRTPTPCAAYLFAVRGDTTMYEVHCVKPQVFRQEIHP